MNRTRSRTCAGWLAAFAVLGVAAWVRIDNFREVLGSGDLIPQVDGDSYYHLRRALGALEHFPRVEHFDPEMNWPRGAFSPWADGFDLGAAVFAGALGGAGHPLRARIAIALWPVALGLLVVWATMRLVRVVAPGSASRAAVVSAGLVAALVPDGVNHSRFGRIDHHVFEALMVVLLTSWSVGRLRPGCARWRAPSAGRFEVEGALLAAAALYGFTGSPLYVAIAAAPLACVAFRDGRLMGSGGPGLVAGGAVAALLAVPAVMDHGRPIAFKVTSFLQPLVVIAVGATVMCAGWWGAAAPGDRRRRVILTAAVTILACPLAAWLGASAASEIHAAVTGWLLHRDAWLATVGEFEPLLSQGIGWYRLHVLLGWSGFFLPVAAVLLAARPLRRRPRLGALLCMLALFAVLVLVQSRFARVIVPLLAVCVGLAVTQVIRRVGGRWRWRQAAWMAPVLVTALFLVDLPSRALLVPAPRPSRLDAYIEAALDLRDRPAANSLPRGALVHWAEGHHVQLLAGVPVVVNGFGTYLDETEFWNALSVFRGSEPELETYLSAHAIGVVFAGVSTIGPEVTGVKAATAFDGRVLSQQHMTKYPLSPLLIAGSAVPGWNVPHLPHLMPRFASRAGVAGISFPLPFLWTYERVPGAVMRGTAPSGARVIAELRFREHGRPHTYKAFADAQDDGSWELILPFPSGLTYPTLQSDARWTVSAGGSGVEVDVPEVSVRTGSVITVAHLAAAPERDAWWAEGARASVPRPLVRARAYRP